MINKCLFLFLVFTVYFLQIQASDYPYPWSQEYTKKLIENASQKEVDLSLLPVFNYPNEGASESVAPHFSNGKILIFGYGSLMNIESASKNISPEALQSMRPAVAFGVKRIFNYKASKTTHWGLLQDEREKAMLNLSPTLTKRSIINGVIFEVGQQEFQELIKREKGYDLGPILVADWDQAIAEDPDTKVHIAYTFYVPNELRYLPDDTIGTNFTQMRYYPVRGYLWACRAGAARFGSEFLDFWNQTTYLANGKTLISDWDENTFKGKLCNKEP